MKISKPAKAKFYITAIALFGLVGSALATDAPVTKGGQKGCLEAIPPLLALIREIKDCPVLTNASGEAIGYGPKCIAGRVNAVRKKADALHASGFIIPWVTKIEACPSRKGSKALDYRCVEEKVTVTYQALANIKQPSFCIANK